MEEKHSEPKSLLEGNGAFVTKILSRNRSVSRSFRIRHWRKAGAVPFNWEALPGRPKDPPEEEFLVQPTTMPSEPAPSRGLQIPKPAASAQTRFKFWKILKKGPEFRLVCCKCSNF